MGQGRSTRAARLPLCGFEFYRPPSNDLETTVTEPAKKRQRNTTELPISVAIEKLRELYTERQTEQDRLLEEMTKKLYERFDERVRRVLLRVPEEFRRHVTNKSGWGGETPEPSPSPAQPAPTDATDAIASDADTSWPNDPPKGAPPMAVIDRDERRAGKGRATNG